ncbi:MAG: LysR substrate-binding domain-containing protein, partial [Pedobacter sp.]|nr:LysR substrate-binding domain-containing protein [Pedobacter sp.]
LVIGATNEPPVIPKLRWLELGTLEWVFAVAPKHPLAKAKEPLQSETVLAHRTIVVADSSRRSDALRSYGVIGGQATLAVPGMREKIQAQRAGLGVGWLPRVRVASLLERGDLLEKKMADPREPNTLYVAWRGDHEGRALQWWLDQLKQPRLAAALVNGVDAFP